MVKKYISLLCLCFSCCLFFGCSKPSGIENDPKQQEENHSDNNLGDKNQSQENNKENNTPEQNDNTQNYSDQENQQDNITSADHQNNQDITGSTVSDVTFEILENYKEKNIPSLYEQ